MGNIYIYIYRVAFFWQLSYPTEVSLKQYCLQTVFIRIPKKGMIKCSSIFVTRNENGLHPFVCLGKPIHGHEFSSFVTLFSLTRLTTKCKGGKQQDLRDQMELDRADLGIDHQLRHHQSVPSCSSASSYTARSFSFTCSVGYFSNLHSSWGSSHLLGHSVSHLKTCRVSLVNGVPWKLLTTEKCILESLGVSRMITLLGKD